MVLGLCLLTDAPLIDQAVPLHLFTLSLWCATALICLAVIRERVHENGQAVSEDDRCGRSASARSPSTNEPPAPFAALEGKLLPSAARMHSKGARASPP
jgi:hypothetical protein